MLLKVFSIFAILFVSLGAVASSESSEAQVTHGGDAYAAEFLKIYTDLRGTMTEPSIQLNTGIEIFTSRLDVVRAKLRVESQPILFRDAREVSAINTPVDFLIKISQKHWNQITRQQKELLVLHEILPIVEVVDDDYEHSSALAQYIEVRKNGRTDPEILGRMILTCNAGFIGSLTQAHYDIFSATDRADYLMLAAWGSCSQYIELAIQFSSEQAVKSSCNGSQRKTTLSVFVSLLSKRDLDHPDAVQAQKTFNLLYQGPQDRMQKCDEASGISYERDICQVVDENQPRFNPLLQSFARQIGCP